MGEGVYFTTFSAIGHATTFLGFIKLLGRKWYLNIVLIYISIIMSEVAHLHMIINAICFCRLLHFWLSWISRNTSYIREIDFVLKPANNVSSICHLTLFYFFTKLKFLMFMWLYLSVFCGFWILSHSLEEISDVAVELLYCLILSGFRNYVSFCFQNLKITQIIQIIFALCFMYFAFVLSSWLYLKW